VLPVDPADSHFNGSKFDTLIPGICSNIDLSLSQNGDHNFLRWVVATDHDMVGGRSYERNIPEYEAGTLVKVPAST
jgi:hypothetical protein